MDSCFHRPMFLVYKRVGQLVVATGILIKARYVVYLEIFISSPQS